MTGRVHLVTGAGRGIGKAIAARLVSAGDSVAIVDVGCRVDGQGRDEEVAAAAATELGGDCLAITADVTDQDAVAAAHAAVLERWGRLDGVINAAAVLRTGNVLTTTDDDWTTTLDVNLRGAMLVSRAAIRSWVDAGLPGRVVNVTSAAGLEGNSEMFAYSVSKAAIVGLTLATSHAVACKDIFVNAIAPLAATRMAIRGMGDEALAARDETGAWPDVAARGLTAERVAPVAAYLVSAELGITGRTFTVGGGQAGLLPVPIPEASVEIDESADQVAVDALLGATFAPRVERSRWQADSLPLERPSFPVADLDPVPGSGPAGTR
jgi:NAD(P)-dependent dehydrogenase (short-subunit alcohol dehydrogenase family)